MVRIGRVGDRHCTKMGAKTDRSVGRNRQAPFLAILSSLGSKLRSDFPYHAHFDAVNGLRIHSLLVVCVEFGGGVLFVSNSGFKTVEWWVCSFKSSHCLAASLATRLRYCACHVAENSHSECRAEITLSRGKE